MHYVARQETIQFTGLQNALTEGYAIARRLPAKAMMEHERLDEFKIATYPTLIEHLNRSKRPFVKIPVEL